MDFIQQANIALFRKRLLETHDIVARRVLLKLLEEEEAKSDPVEVRPEPLTRK